MGVSVSERLFLGVEEFLDHLGRKGVQRLVTERGQEDGVSDDLVSALAPWDLGKLETSAEISETGLGQTKMSMFQADLEGLERCGGGKGLQSGQGHERDEFGLVLVRNSEETVRAIG